MSETEHKLDGHHSLQDKWMIPGLAPLDKSNRFIIDMTEIAHLLTPESVKQVSFEEVSHKTDPKRDLRRYPRYQNCDIGFPGILVMGMPNPDNRRYRMIDGNHRLHKMKDLSLTQAAFYVLEYDDIKPWIRPLHPI